MTTTNSPDDNIGPARSTGMQLGEVGDRVADKACSAFQPTQISKTAVKDDQVLAEDCA